MKPGRNDRCPCGSGRKYKNCCLAKAQAESEAPGEIAWRRIRRANENLIPKMLRFVVEVYGEDAFDEAWDEFMLWDEDLDLDERIEFDQSPHQSVFMPWLLHRWSPDPSADTVVTDKRLHGVPPTRAFLDAHAKHLEPVTQRYLEACLAAPFSFYEIIEVERNHHFRARELMSGREHVVMERSATQMMERGHILFASFAQVDGIVMLEACSPMPIQPKYKEVLIGMRSEIAKTADPKHDGVLIGWDLELRLLYLELAEAILNPRIPELRNTDGDPLSPQQLIFDIDSPQQAFDALKHLSLDISAEELLVDAKRTPDGSLKSVEIPWMKRGNKIHQHWDNTTLGQIEIDGARLTIDVNSQQRADEFKRIVATALGSGARYRVTKMESIERSLSEPRRGKRLSTPEQDDLMSRPEVQQALREMIARHYADWVNQKLPALHDKTPLEAVRNPEGRELVEALIRQMELDGCRMQPPLDVSITQQLRERLGLAPS